MAIYLAKEPHKGRKHKLKRLLDGSPESYYWLGFILADGHFTESGRMPFSLADKDRGHLEKLATYLDVYVTTYISPRGYVYARLAVMDVATIKTLRERYLISNNKTIKPPKLSSLSKEEIEYISIGFIDGDGNIRKQPRRQGARISIKVHGSWEETLKILFPTAQCAINACGYARAFITRHSECVRLKTIAKSLPSLQRKWDEIDEEFVSKYDVASERLAVALEMKEAGFRNIDIAKHIGISAAGVTKLFRRYYGE